MTVTWKHYHVMLNMADDDLDVYEYRLLGHYQRVGTCYESTPTTAENCKMSAGKVSQAKRSLREKGYINVQKRKGTSDLVTVVDRMTENIARYKDASRSSHETVQASRSSGAGVRSPHERSRSPHETKNNQLRNNQTRIGVGGGEGDLSESGEFSIQGEPAQNVPKEPAPEPVLSEQRRLLSEVCDKNGERVNLATLKRNPDDYTVEDIKRLIQYALTAELNHPVRYICKIINDGLPVPAIPEKRDPFAEYMNQNDAQPAQDWTPPPTPPSLKDSAEAYRVERDLPETGREAWQIAHNQLEIQFDRASFDTWLKNIAYAGYDHECNAIVLMVKDRYQQDMLQHRMYRNVQRVLSDSLEREVNIEFVLMSAPVLAGGAT